MGEFVDDVRLALAGLGGPAVAFGYSMGGYAACRLEAEAPGSLAAILTLGTKFDWDAPTAAVEAGRLDPDALAAKVPRFAQALAARHAAMGWRAVMIATAGLLAGLGEVGGFGLQRAAAVACPVRVTLGDRDELVPLEEAARYARAFPAGELAVLPRTPHPLERVGVDRLAGEVLDLALSLG
jgi:pimeloyl-ACP methyl ester carboxylesterase